MTSDSFGDARADRQTEGRGLNGFFYPRIGKLDNGASQSWSQRFARPRRRALSHADEVLSVLVFTLQEFAVLTDSVLDSLSCCLDHLAHGATLDI